MKTARNLAILAVSATLMSGCFGLQNQIAALKADSLRYKEQRNEQRKEEQRRIEAIWEESRREWRELDRRRKAAMNSSEYRDCIRFYKNLYRNLPQTPAVAASVRYQCKSLLPSA